MRDLPRHIGTVHRWAAGFLAEGTPGPGRSARSSGRGGRRTRRPCAGTTPRPPGAVRPPRSPRTSRRTASTICRAASTRGPGAGRVRRSRRRRGYGRGTRGRTRCGPYDSARTDRR
ncbi:hypothetical protein [Streptomyces sp. LaBMicrA B280]|uniref:hypothetical protein n=1 Tax=Streptomyces sp. LaBMicrA B280 TaxID=3391001 RepID=UPI003BA6A9D6